MFDQQYMNYQSQDALTHTLCGMDDLVAILGHDVILTPLEQRVCEVGATHKVGTQAPHDPSYHNEVQSSTNEVL